LTGRTGMRLFSDAINDKFKGLGVTIVQGEGRFIGGSGNRLTFLGDQWVTANFPNGVSLTIKYLPIYDDLIDNRILDPVTGRPTESMRFTIFNIGNNGTPGIQKYAKKDSENIYKILAGMYNPYDLPNSKTNRYATPTAGASGFDGCEIKALAHEGICLADPTSAAELIYSVA
jgi:hypothetical protein